MKIERIRELYKNKPPLVMLMQWNRIQQNKPAIFDWLVFIISLLMGFLFPELRDLTASTSFSMWMLAGLVLYMAGLWLKQLPVYYRLAKAGMQKKRIPYLLFLIIGHWVIMLAVVVIAEDAFRQITGMSPINRNDPSSGMQVFISIVASLLITWFAFRGSRNNNKQLPGKYLLYRELAGDIILISAVSMFSFVFWEKSLLGAMAHMQMNSFGDIFLLFIFLSFAYMLFYLPLRYLYLIEDNNRQAWRRLLIIFILILVRGLFEALRH